MIHPMIHTFSEGCVKIIIPMNLYQILIISLEHPEIVIFIVNMENVSQFCAEVNQHVNIRNNIYECEDCRTR